MPWAAPAGPAQLGAAVAGPIAVWPLTPRPEVVRGFEPPPKPWLPGHRGLDLRGSPGQQVRSATPGTVTHAGPLAGRGVIVITNGRLRTTYEPVIPTVHIGALVTPGTPLGNLSAAGSHCPPATCLHWGLLQATTYLNPLALLPYRPIRLLPLTPLPYDPPTPLTQWPFTAPAPLPPRLFTTPAPLPPRLVTVPAPQPPRLFTAPTPLPPRLFTPPTPQPPRLFTAPAVTALQFISPSADSTTHLVAPPPDHRASPASPTDPQLLSRPPSKADSLGPGDPPPALLERPSSTPLAPLEAQASARGGLASGVFVGLAAVATLIGSLLIRRH